MRSDPLIYQLYDLGLLFNPWSQFLIHEMKVIFWGVIGKNRLNEMNLKDLGLEYWEGLAFNIVMPRLHLGPT